MPYAEFIEFYKKSLKLDESDFKNFVKSIERPLPSAFRISPTQHSDVIKSHLEKYKFLTKIPFLKNCYSFEIKKEKSEEYTEFINFLVAQTDVGNIQRQELVSFFPHKFLQIKKSHFVLETCASPGSKTKNLLEELKDGILISNEKSQSRVNILISESMKKATPNFIITNLDASNFPNLNIKFDRICCDVPCSGDGTCRKNPAIMPKWGVRDSIGLSGIQLRILKRSLDLLKEGGILVYSTCSLSAIENEWVINNALNDSYEILNEYDFIKYYSKDDTLEYNSKIIVREGITEFEYENFKFNNPKLSKCIRILPQDQNTGGFFICVIRKINTNDLNNNLNNCNNDNTLVNNLNNGNNLNNNNINTNTNSNINTNISTNNNNNINTNNNTNISTNSNINNTNISNITNNIENVIKNFDNFKVFDNAVKKISKIIKNKPKFFEINDEIKEKIERNCDISKTNCHFISFNSNFKNIFAISDLAFNIILNNPKLKVSYAGIKAFTYFDMEKDKFRAKSQFLEALKIPVEYNLDFEDFRKLLKNSYVSADELKIKCQGLFTCKVIENELIFSGFSGGNKVFLYIDDNHRKAYSQLYE